MDRVDVVAHYNKTVSSPSVSMNIPSVIVLKNYVSRRRIPPFTRFNLYLRDNFSCQYCGEQGYIHNYRQGVRLTLDHVYPKSRGGHLSWQNTVAACAECNTKKGDKTPKEANMPLLKEPKAPSEYKLKLNAKAYPPESLHQTWRTFLVWDRRETEDMSAQNAAEHVPFKT